MKTGIGERPKPGVGAISLEWWLRYCDPERGDPALRAKLRRARTSFEALTIPAGAVLVRRLGGVTQERSLEAALDLARVLAHVRENTERSAMVTGGWKRFPHDRGSEDAKIDPPRISESRFIRLLRADRADGELAAAFIRLVDMLDGKVSVSRLAEDFWYWSDRVRQRWAYEYYAVGASAPDAMSESQPPEPTEDVA